MCQLKHFLNSTKITIVPTSKNEVIIRFLVGQIEKLCVDARSVAWLVSKLGGESAWTENGRKVSRRPSKLSRFFLLAVTA